MFVNHRIKQNKLWSSCFFHLSCLGSPRETSRTTKLGNRTSWTSSRCSCFGRCSTTSSSKYQRTTRKTPHLKPDGLFPSSVVWPFFKVHPGAHSGNWRNHCCARRERQNFTSMIVSRGSQAHGAGAGDAEHVCGLRDRGHAVSATRSEELRGRDGGDGAARHPPLQHQQSRPGLLTL